jgi:serine/threonine protein kinase
MSRFPDFSPQGYQVVSELGRNREGGRITWLVSDITTGRQVVLKQFCFAQAGSSWSGFNAYQREIQILQELNHPGIPRYLGAFAKSDGFCMVQEYINAPSLAVQRSLEPEEIKQIAISALEILVYLQNRIPPVIHRDIKPENILVDEQLNVYLIDFGFARVGNQEVSGSSVFKGTPGFIPPEQMRKPTEASDLYSLGTTLICLLTGTVSSAILDLTDKDDPYLIHFRHLLPSLSLRFLDWLELMVQPSLKRRFVNAHKALEVLKPLALIRVSGVEFSLIRAPGVEFSEAVLKFQANKLGEKLTQTITIENVVPETLLEGRWEVAPHPHDPPHTPESHAWICVTPTKFAGNKTLCHIQVDTSNLMANKLYKRQLLLYSNAYPEIHTLTVKVQTAPLPIERRKLPYLSLAVVFLFYAIAPKLITWHMASDIATIRTFYFFLFLLPFVFILILPVIGAVESLIERMSLDTRFPKVIAVVKVVLRAGFIPFMCMLMLLQDGDSAGRNRWKGIFTNILWLFTAGFGTSLGVGWIVGFFNPYILLALAGTGIPLATMLFYPPLKRRRLIANYRKSEQHLIKP